jgi:hypothetical protein
MWRGIISRTWVQFHKHSQPSCCMKKVENYWWCRKRLFGLEYIDPKGLRSPYGKERCIYITVYRISLALIVVLIWLWICFHNWLFCHKIENRKDKWYIFITRIKDKFSKRANTYFLYNIWMRFFYFRMWHSDSN